MFSFFKKFKYHPVENYTYRVNWKGLSSSYKTVFLQENGWGWRKLEIMGDPLINLNEFPHYHTVILPWLILDGFEGKWDDELLPTKDNVMRLELVKKVRPTK